MSVGEGVTGPALEVALEFLGAVRATVHTAATERVPPSSTHRPNLTIVDSVDSMAPHSVKILVGDVAQLGERLNGIQEVEGSTPFVSTNHLRKIGGSKTALHPVRAPVNSRLFNTGKA